MLLLLATTATISLTTGFRAAMVLRDPADIAELPWYTGALSNLGVLLWSATAAICAFSAALLWRVGPSRQAARLFLAFGGLTALLLADDLLLLHERVLPGLVPSASLVTAAVYATLGTLILAIFRRQIIARGWELLLVAFGLLGFSAVFDLAHDYDIFWIANSSIRHLIEDGAKLLGITAWFLYALTATTGQIRADLVPASRTEHADTSQTSAGASRPVRRGPPAAVAGDDS